MKALSSKLLIRISIGIIFLSAISFLVFNENGILKYLRMKSELRQLNEEITSAEDRLKVLNAEIDSLKTSRLKIEKVAREKFDMMGKKEKVFKIDEK